ncbi:MAG: type II secretion system F family protein [Acidimicrobiales bacterium]
MTAAAALIGTLLAGLVLACGAASMAAVAGARRDRIFARLLATPRDEADGPDHVRPERSRPRSAVVERMTAAPSRPRPTVLERLTGALSRPTVMERPTVLERMTAIERPTVIERVPAVLLRRRREAERSRALAPAVEAVARSLRAGGSVRTALADAAAVARPPLGDELGLVVKACEQGIPIRQAIEHWAARPTADVRLIAAAVALGVDAGAGLARTLDGVAATLYERAAVDREVRALSTQARYSAAVLAVAPLVFLAVVAGLDGGTLRFLLGTPAGLACLGLGLGLDLAGGWWMARITRGAT